MGRVRHVRQVGHFQALNWLGLGTWYCLIVGWMRRGRANSQNPLSHVSHMSHLQLASWEALRLAQCFTLRLSKREALKTVFDCFRAAEVLLFSLFLVRGVWRSLPPVESAGNDIVRELMGIV